MINNATHLAELKSSKQSIQARVEIYDGSTLVKTCTCDNALSDFSVERVGEHKFFGYGICHKLTAKLIDFNREIIVTPTHSIQIAFGVNGNFVYPFPTFYAQAPERDETTNELTITAYDALYRAAEHTLEELGLAAPYTIEAVAAACATLLGCEFATNVTDSSFSTSYEKGANFEGTEKIRAVLNTIAEATQTIYYINNEEKLIFKRLEKDAAALFTINKNMYYELSSGAEHTLAAICHATELGDNVIAPSDLEGVTQYVRNNPFWDLREDVATLVENAQAAIGGITIAAFDSAWSGNYLLEIGDKIEFLGEVNQAITTYLLEDTIIYDGTLEGQSAWSFEENDAETIDNPTSLGEALNQTFAKVDKVNKEITMQAGRVDANSSSIAALSANADSIRASVKKVETTTKEAIEALENKQETLTKEVSAKMSAEDVQIAISTEIDKGVDKVKTTTGYTFDEKGMTVSKTDSEMTTTITEDGMTIYKAGEEVLTATNQGVNAQNLHATTYLIIGKNSRFEDLGQNRTGCFWIGGA